MQNYYIFYFLKNLREKYYCGGKKHTILQRLFCHFFLGRDQILLTGEHFPSLPCFWLLDGRSLVRIHWVHVEALVRRGGEEGKKSLEEKWGRRESRPPTGFLSNFHCNSQLFCLRHKSNSGALGFSLRRAFRARRSAPWGSGYLDPVFMLPCCWGACWLRVNLWVLHFSHQLSSTEKLLIRDVCVCVWGG